MINQNIKTNPFTLKTEASEGIKIAPIEDLRVPRKIKKRIKKSKYNIYKIIKIKCYRNCVTNKIYYDLFFTTNTKELHDL